MGFRRFNPLTGDGRPL